MNEIVLSLGIAFVLAYFIGNFLRCNYNFSKIHEEGYQEIWKFKSWDNEYV